MASKTTGELDADVKGRCWGVEFCPTPTEPMMDGCYYCGKPIPSPYDGNHNHTQTEKVGFRGATQDRYSCVCDYC